MPFDRWTFHDFVEEIIMLDEISFEVPGLDEMKYNLLVQAWKRYPEDCARINMRKVENYVFNDE